MAGTRSRDTHVRGAHTRNIPGGASPEDTLLEHGSASGVLGRTSAGEWGGLQLNHDGGR